MTINERLFALLDERGFSNADLAKGTGIRANTISDWKTKGTNPSADKIYRICEFLGVSCEYLLTGKEPPSNPAGPDDLTEEQKDLLDGFSKLDKIEQQIIMGKIAEFLYNKKGTAEIATETAFDLSAHIGAKDRVR